MCLIGYVPAGKKMPEDYIDAAAKQNDDGIGIMSEDGIRKFLGRKALKRAKRYVRQLHEDEIEYAIHFRYATHGDVTQHNCHPHELPNSNGWMMHNGVLSAYTKYATKKDSDTAIFASDIVDADASNENRLTYWKDIARIIGSNKLCVMTPDHEFILVNESYGTWRDGIWYSQTYSLPYPKYEGVTTAYGHGYTNGYNPYWRREMSSAAAYEVDKPDATPRTATIGGTFVSTSNETRLYPRNGEDVGAVWGNWERRYDDKTGKAYYVRPEEGPSVPPSLTAPAVNTALKDALERKDAERGETCSPWAAWARDRDGNDPAEQDKALDTELAKHLELENNCAICFAADLPVDEDGICEECLLKEIEAEDRAKDGLNRGWSEIPTEATDTSVVPFEPGTCIECGGRAYSGNGDFCGEAFCIGVGYTNSVRNGAQV